MQIVLAGLWMQPEPCGAMCIYSCQRLKIDEHLREICDQVARCMRSLENPGNVGANNRTKIYWYSFVPEIFPQGHGRLADISKGTNYHLSMQVINYRHNYLFLSFLSFFFFFWL